MLRYAPSFSVGTESPAAGLSHPYTVDALAKFLGLVKAEKRCESVYCIWTWYRSGTTFPNRVIRNAPNYSTAPAAGAVSHPYTIEALAKFLGLVKQETQRTDLIRVAPGYSSVTAAVTLPRHPMIDTTVEMMAPAVFLEICRRLDQGELISHDDVLVIMRQWENAKYETNTRVNFDRCHDRTDSTE